MHIQRKPALIVGVLVVLAVVAWAVTRPAKTKLTAPTAIPVRVVSVKEQDIPRFVSGIGSVLSLHSVVIRPQIDGILTQLLVKEGQLVKAGDLLATIDDRSIRASLDQAKAQLGESQAQLQVALVNLKRYKELSIDDGVSKQTYDQQQALVNQLKATAQGNQAAIDSAQVQLSYTQIRSPVTGRVGIRTVDEGNFLRMSDTQGLFSVTQIDPIAVEFSLPQQMLPTLQGLIASPTQASVDAYMGADTDGQTGDLLGEGHLSLIDNQISSTTGTLRGLTPGVHGIHIHAVGRCEPPFQTAGGHWNPLMRKHGVENPDGPHAGDMQNIVVGSDGTATVSVTTPMGTLRGANGLLDTDGASVVVHAAADDYKTDPSGNSGARVACGVVRVL